MQNFSHSMQEKRFQIGGCMDKEYKNCAFFNRKLAISRYFKRYGQGYY